MITPCRLSVTAYSVYLLLPEDAPFRGCKGHTEHAVPDKTSQRSCLEIAVTRFRGALPLGPGRVWPTS
jgi:hypothetical protein